MKQDQGKGTEVCSHYWPSKEKLLCVESRCLVQYPKPSLLAIGHLNICTLIYTANTIPCQFSQQILRIFEQILWIQFCPVPLCRPWGLNWSWQAAEQAPLLAELAHLLFLCFIFFFKGKRATWSPITITIHTPLFRKPPSVLEEVVKWAHQYTDRKGRNSMERRPLATWYLGATSPQTHLSMLCTLLTLPHITGTEVWPSTLIWIPETNPKPTGIWAAFVLGISSLGQQSQWERRGNV